MKFIKIACVTLFKDLCSLALRLLVQIKLQANRNRMIIPDLELSLRIKKERKEMFPLKPLVDRKPLTCCICFKALRPCKVQQQIPHLRQYCVRGLSGALEKLIFPPEMLKCAETKYTQTGSRNVRK